MVGLSPFPNYEDLESHNGSISSRGIRLSRQGWGRERASSGEPVPDLGRFHDLRVISLLLCGPKN